MIKIWAGFIHHFKNPSVRNSNNFTLPALNPLKTAALTLKNLMCVIIPTPTNTGNRSGENIFKIFLHNREEEKDIWQ